MLKDAKCFKKIVIVCGRVDMRKGADGLAAIVRLRYGINTLEKDTLFLFRGLHTDRIRGLVWEGDGYLLLSKRLIRGSFQWPRNREEAKTITQEEFERLMNGFAIDPVIRLSKPQKSA